MGHIVSRNDVAADPTKIQAIVELPIPANVKELRGFLGLTLRSGTTISKGATL